MGIAELILKYVQALIWPAVLLGILWSLRSRVPFLVDRITSAEAPGGFRLDFSERLAQLRDSVDTGTDEQAEIDSPEEERDPSENHANAMSQGLPREEDHQQELTVHTNDIAYAPELSLFRVVDRESLVQAAQKGRRKASTVRLRQHFDRPRSNRGKVVNSWDSVTAQVTSAMDQIIPIEWSKGDSGEIAQAQIDALYALTGISSVEELSRSYRLLRNVYKDMPGRVKEQDAENFMESASSISEKLATLLRNVDAELNEVPRRRRIRAVSMEEVERAGSRWPE